MSPVDPKFYRRQKEVARQQKQKEKRAERASRRERGAPADDGVAAIQAALDAGLTPGSPGWPGQEDEPTSGEDEGSSEESEEGQGSPA